MSSLKHSDSIMQHSNYFIPSSASRKKTWTWSYTFGEEGLYSYLDGEIVSLSQLERISSWWINQCEFYKHWHRLPTIDAHLVLIHQTMKYISAHMVYRKICQNEQAWSFRWATSLDVLINYSILTKSIIFTFSYAFTILSTGYNT